MRKMSARQNDAFTEIVNIGVGEAANSLGELVGSHIVLKVPLVELLPVDGLPKVASELETKRVSSVIQSFSGDFDGTATLIFPPDAAAKLIMAITGEENTAPELDSVRSSTLMEIGNIVINALIGTMSNLLECSLNYRLPEYYQDEASKLFSRIASHEQTGVVLLVQTDFTIENLRIKGFVLIVFRLSSVEALISKIDRYASE